MTPDFTTDSKLEDRLCEILAEFVEEADRGGVPDEEAYLARYPEFADDLRRCFANYRKFPPPSGAKEALPLAGDALPSATSFEPPPETLGDFRIVREIGRGGMGVVYEAEELSLRRRVALKVLPFAGMLDPRQLQRFRNEAQAAAFLHHGNIVPVYFVGCERGTHFYAMQLIEGQTLAAVIRALRRESGEPGTKVPAERPAAEPPAEGEPSVPHVHAPTVTAETLARTSLSTDGPRRGREYFRKVAQLGVQAAEALDYAHQMGVLHRDIKPANLMLDSRGTLWVTDFGLAHMQHGDGSLTMTGDLVGMLRYMSPEQALAKRVIIDQRTDVYSLGATLYEMLTLQPAFKGTDRQELLRQVAFEEPVAPRRVDRSIPLEIETIVLKAMEKNPADRYATAQELADDLRRWLEDQPIKARRPSLRQVATRWARRHRVLVGAAAVVLLLGVTMLAGTVGWVASDRAGRRRATEQVVTQALDESASWQEKRRLPEALSAARRAAGLVDGREADEALRRRVQARMKDLELLARLDEARLEWTTGGGGRFDTAHTVRRYGEIFRDAKLDVDAMTAEQAAEGLRGLSVAIELAAVLDEWAMFRRELQPRDDANWKHLLRVARAVDPDSWRSRLREAFERRDREALIELASSDQVVDLLPLALRTLAVALGNSRAIDDAVRLLRTGQRLHPDDFCINEELGLALSASTQRQQGEGFPFLMVAVALRPQSSMAHNNLGAALYDKKDLNKAVAEIRTAIDLDPKNATAHHNLGKALYDKKDLDKAVAEFRTAIDLDPKLVSAHNGLGSYLCDMKDLDKAIAEFRTAIDLDPKYADSHGALGQALMQQGRFAEAETSIRRCLNLLPQGHSMHGVVTWQLKQLRLFQAQEKKLLDVLAGKAKPASVAEQVQFANLCQMMRRYASGAKLYAEAFTTDAKQAENLSLSHRYNAACAAALAGCGQGTDAADLSDKERARLRQQAMDWLRADLAAWRNQLEKDKDKTVPVVGRQMRHWLGDSDFNGVRGAAALGKLSEAERKEWHKLWDDVAVLGKRAAGAK